MGEVLHIGLWSRDEGRCIGAHEHPCPECYERPLCVEPCSRASDLEEGGPQSGAYMTCEACLAIAGKGPGR